MKLRDLLGVRPEGRINVSKKSRSQERRENIQADGREEINLPKPKPGLGMVCLYCGAHFPSLNKDATICPKCATPF